MASEFDRYIPEIQALNVHRIPEWQKTYAAKRVGDWMLNADPTSGEIERTQKYLHSELKLKTESVFASILHTMFANQLSRALAWGVERVDPGTPGFFSYEVGFSASRMIEITKIRTLKRGSIDVLSKSPFGEAMWQRDESYLADLKIPNPFIKRLRSGWDEMPQLKRVKNGTMALVSPRAFLAKELEGLGILKELRHEPELKFTDEVKRVLFKHEFVMIDQDVKPGIINPVSSLNLGVNSSPMFRLYAGMQYALCGASFQTDTAMALNSISRRAKRFVWNHQNGVKT